MELCLSWEGLGAMMVASVCHGHLPLMGIPGPAAALDCLLTSRPLSCSPVIYRDITVHSKSPGQNGVAK